MQAFFRLRREPEHERCWEAGADPARPRSARRFGPRARDPLPGSLLSAPISLPLSSSLLLSLPLSSSPPKQPFAASNAMEAAPPNPVKRPLTLSDGFREEGEGAADKRSRRMPERSAEPAEGAMNSNPGALRLLPRRDAVRVLAEPALGVGDSPSRESPPESHALSRFASDTALQLQLRVSIDRTLARICASPSLVAPCVAIRRVQWAREESGEE